MPEDQVKKLRRKITVSRYVAIASVVFALLLVAATGVTAAEKGKKAEKPAEAAKAELTTQPAYLDKEHAPKGKGWIALCNGKDLTGWKFFPEKAANSWKVVDGILVSAFKQGEHGTNIYTQKKFGDFELYYEYCVPKGGNSGVFLRGQYEIQILDDHGVPADNPKDWGNGGIYGEKAPSKNMSKPAGEWQSGYVKMVGNKITVFINGEKVIDNFTPPGATYLHDELKTKDGEPSGPIVLQGDHRPIKFRHVMIKPIKK